MGMFQSRSVKIPRTLQIRRLSARMLFVKRKCTHSTRGGLKKVGTKPKVVWLCFIVTIQSMLKVHTTEHTQLYLAVCFPSSHICVDAFPMFALTHFPRLRDASLSFQRKLNLVGFFWQLGDADNVQCREGSCACD